MFNPGGRSNPHEDLLHKDRIYFASRAATDSEIQNCVLPAFAVIWSTMQAKYRAENDHFYPPTEYRVAVKGKTKGQTFLLGHAAFISEEMLANPEFLPAVLAYMCGGIETMLGTYSLIYRHQNYDEFEEPEAFKPYPLDIVYGGGLDFTAYAFETMHGMAAIQKYIASVPGKDAEEYLYFLRKNTTEQPYDFKRLQYRSDEFAAFACGQRDTLIKLLQKHHQIVTHDTEDVFYYNNTIADRIRYLQGTQLYRDTTVENTYKKTNGRPLITEDEYAATHTISTDSYFEELDAKLADLEQKGEQSPVYQDLVEYVESVMSRKK